MKIHSPPQIKLVLYDSSKTTISLTIVSPQLEVCVHNNNCFTYIDDARNCWLLICSNSQESLNIVEELQKYDVKIKQNDNCEPKLMPEFTDQSNTKITTAMINETSDTENKNVSSLNNSKASIINRMAIVGQAILPLQSSSELVNDSSYDNENCSKKIRKQKHLKHNTKKYIESDKPDVYTSSAESDHENTKLIQVKSNTTNTMPLHSLNTQLIPITHKYLPEEINCAKCCHLNATLSEQRISNSEVCLSLNKMDFKLDQILETLKVHGKSNNESTFTTDIYRKLLTEYENQITDQKERIKTLETKISEIENCNVISLLSKNDNQDTLFNLKMKDQDVDNLKDKINDLENEIMEKNKEIEKLKNHVSELLTATQKKHVSHLNDDIFFQKLTELNIDNVQRNSLKNSYLQISDELIHLKEIHKDLKDNFERTVKGIMNNTYHLLSENFSNNEQYTGDNIKQIIATTIKKLTIKNLSD